MNVRMWYNFDKNNPSTWPDFEDYGFHKEKKINVMTKDSQEVFRTSYLGYGEFGNFNKRIQDVVSWEE